MNIWPISLESSLRSNEDLLELLTLAGDGPIKRFASTLGNATLLLQALPKWANAFRILDVNDVGAICAVVISGNQVRWIWGSIVVSEAIVDIERAFKGAVLERAHVFYAGQLLASSQ